MFTGMNIKQKMETKKANGNLIKFYLDAFFQGVKRFFVLAFDDTTVCNNNDSPNRVKRNSHRKYFLSRVNITNYNVLIDGWTFYDQSINDQIKKYDEFRKISTGQGDD